jgi:hypothetical protein
VTRHEQHEKEQAELLASRLCSLHNTVKWRNGNMIVSFTMGNGGKWNRLQPEASQFDIGSAGKGGDTSVNGEESLQ